MYAKLIDHMGDDLKVANSARASFGAKSNWVTEEYYPTGMESEPAIRKVLSKKDANLIRYLARGCPSAEMEALIDKLSSVSNGIEEAHREDIRKTLNNYRGTSTHWVPFAHCQLTFEVSMPIFIARQLIHHTVGVSISEMSRRYVSENPEYYYPEGWRLQAANVKQGSSDVCLEGEDARQVTWKVVDFCEQATDLYRWLVDEKKVAPEQARMVLPINAYTDWTWTVSLVTAARVCHQRLDPHAQKEIRDLAQMVYDACMEKFPVSFKSLMDYGTE